ncbi:serine hydrolase [Bacillus salipaludis]|uniref:serine hydrolase n=1 Tax=Bacillus salipaludis TaxID=2547811 RepID=UPI003D25BC92
MKEGRLLKGILAILMIAALMLPTQSASAAELTAQKDFSKKAAAELNRYIKKAGGTVTLQYQDLITGDSLQIRGKTSGRAASTIKLPLTLYIMEQASKGKINLNQKLTYKKHHYYSGSGVIQYQKVGTRYTIRDLVQKAIIYSDNIAFIMLKERVGQGNFVKYMKSLGGKYTYPNGQNLTSANDLTIYAKKLYQFSNKSKYGDELVGYLKQTIYNTTIPRGIKGVSIAHKVGMIPMYKVYNDVAIVYHQQPFTLAIMTKNISYEKSQRVIADLARIVYKYHIAKTAVKYFKSKTDVTVYQKRSKTTSIGKLKKAETFKITSKQGTWYGIKFGTGTGYIEKQSVTAIKSPIKLNWTTSSLKAGTIEMNQDVNVLSQPTGGKVIGVLKKGQECYFSRLENNVYMIDLGGRVGYVASKDVTVVPTINK